MPKQNTWYTVHQIAEDLDMTVGALNAHCANWRENREKGLPYLKAEKVLDTWQISASSLKRFKAMRKEVHERQRIQRKRPVTRRQKKMLLQAAELHQRGLEEGNYIELMKANPLGRADRPGWTETTRTSLIDRELLEELNVGTTIVYPITEAGLDMLKQLEDYRWEK